jgi:hypothetical protein
LSVLILFIKQRLTPMTDRYRTKGNSYAHDDHPANQWSSAA